MVINKIYFPYTPKIKTSSSYPVPTHSLEVGMGYLYFRTDLRPALISSKYYSTKYVNRVSKINKMDLILRDEKLYNSTIGLNFTQRSRNEIYFSYDSYIFSQIIGHLLGDGNLSMTWSSKNPSFVFTQGLIRFNYAWDVFNNLKFLCKSMPRLGRSNRNGKIFYHIQVQTRSYPFFKDIYNAFYVSNETKELVKIIPDEMFYWLNPISLAYWAMDDGSYTTSGSGYYLHTKGFSFKDVYFLAGILHYKFDIYTTVQNHENRPVIYIKARSKCKFFNIIKPYFHVSMLYKFK
jgi:LAGLIDADG DNA endonuclease family